MTDKGKHSGSGEILFVVPPSLRFAGLSSYALPMGLGHLVSTLKKLNISASIYNADIHITKRPRFTIFIDRAKGMIKDKLGIKSYPSIATARKWAQYHKNVHNTKHPHWIEVETALRKLNPKIVGISSKAVDIPSTLVLAALVKKVLPCTKVVIGGPSSTTCTEILMQADAIDYIVFGEGEITMAELSLHLLRNSAADIRNIQGLAYRDNNGQFSKTRPRPLVADLDEIPFPDRESMFYIDEDGNFKDLVRAEDIITSRGCPFGCRFCATQLVWGGKKQRVRSIDNVIAEITYLTTKFNQKHFIIWDDLFTLNRNRVLEFCRKVVENKLSISWLCLMRVNTVDAALLKMMKDAGCYEIQIGIESGNDRILRYINKGINLKMIRDIIPIIRESGLNWRAFFIIGFPTETKQEMQDTLDLIDEIQPTYSQLSIFAPYPGTELHSELVQEGAININMPVSVDMQNPCNNYTGTMNDKEFRKYIYAALKRVEKQQCLRTS